MYTLDSDAVGLWWWDISD